MRAFVTFITIAGSSASAALADPPSPLPAPAPTQQPSPVFPSAHSAQSNSWNSGSDYVRDRTCSSTLDTSGAPVCVANVKGYISDGKEPCGRPAGGWTENRFGKTESRAQPCVSAETTANHAHGGPAVAAALPSKCADAAFAAANPALCSKAQLQVQPAPADPR